MSKIIVLGAGVMGSAFAQLLADTGNDVCLVGTHLDRDIIDSLQADGTHPGLKVKLPDTVRAYPNEELEQTVWSADSPCSHFIIGKYILT